MDLFSGRAKKHRQGCAYFWAEIKSDIFKPKNGADEDASLKGDSPSSTETDSGVSEGCSDNGMSTEDEDMDSASGGVNRLDGTNGLKKVELTEDLVNSGLAHDMKVRTLGPLIIKNKYSFSICCKEV